MASFAIEVPGEANPLTETDLVQTLSRAVSTDTTQIKTSTQQLERWEKAPSYYRLLQSAYLDHGLPAEIRYMAIIQLKNGIDKYWRKTAKNAVSKEDKDVIRSRLLDSILDEPDNLLARQNAILIAKIARYEFPRDWPDLFNSLLTSIKQSQALQRSRTLLVLLHIIKELATGRLQSSRYNLQKATPEIVHVLATLYASLVEAWGSGVAEQLESPMEESLLTIKVLRRLLIFGYDNPNRDNGIAALWQLTQQHLGTLMEQQKAGHPQIALIEKHIVQIAKLHHEMARDHPASFALLPNSMDLVRSYWGLVKYFGESYGSKEAVRVAVSSATIGTGGESDDQKPAIEKLTLKGLLIVRACVKMVHYPAQTFKHRTPEDKEERSRATEVIKQDLLTVSFVQDVMETIITRYFVFRANDLREWEEEPEEWEKREEGDGEDWEFSIRSCSEKLFLDLLINYKGFLVEPFLQAFYSVATLDNSNVIIKDAMYCATGLAAPVVHEHFDIDSFVEQILLKEILVEDRNYNIIRRRSSILLGHWVPVKLASTSWPTVYSIFQHLLSSTVNDQVVRLTAGRQFKKVCDAWEFDPDQFVPFADTILTDLMGLTEAVELTETKMALLDTISCLVARLDNRIIPFAWRIITLLSPLWNAADEETLMRQAIIVTFSRLVNAMKGDGVQYHQYAFPIIHLAIGDGDEASNPILEEALELWHDILIQTPAPVSQESLNLEDRLTPIYQNGSDNLRKAIDISESYVLLAPDNIFQRDSLWRNIYSMATTLKGERKGVVCNLIESIIQMAYIQQSSRGVDEVFRNLEASGVLPILLEGLKDTWNAHRDSDSWKEPLINGLCETDHFSVIARLILQGDLQDFMNAGADVANNGMIENSHLDPPVLRSVFEEWFQHFDNVGDPSRRKLMSLAFAKMVRLHPWFSRHYLQSCMSVWTSVIVELRDDEENLFADSLVYEGGTVEYDAQTPEDERRRLIKSRDPVHTLGLPSYVRDNLKSVMETYGAEKFQQEFISPIDHAIFSAFKDLGILD